MGEIIVSGIQKKFDKTEVIKGIDLTIKDASFTIILGPSGCGKSTLLRILSGLETPDQGNVQIAGRDVTYAEPKDRQVAMVFQNYALYPHMTAYKNVEYSLKIKKVPTKEREQRVMEALKTVDMEDQAQKLPSQMSGGQRQRVALARAIVKSPEAFLMDEPLSNLDAKLRNQMRHNILELHEKLGTTFVYVTHDQTEAMTMGDHIVLLNEGNIVQQGSPKEIYTNPNHIFVAGFIGNPPANIIKMPFGYIGIRPEDLHMEKMDNAAAVKGMIKAAEPMGSDVLYEVQTLVGHLHMKADNQWNEVRKTIVMYVPMSKILYFDEEGKRIYDVGKEVMVFRKMAEG